MVIFWTFFNAQIGGKKREIGGKRIKCNRLQGYMENCRLGSPHVMRHKPIWTPRGWEFLLGYSIDFDKFVEIRNLNFFAALPTTKWSVLG